MFSDAGGTWTQQAELTASDAAIGTYFGWSVALSGTTALVGADNAPNNAHGTAYVFSDAGGTWTQRAELTASDAAPNDLFGYSVALSGTTALVGAYGHHNSAGAAYVFSDAGGTWTQRAELTASDAAPNDSFGYSVALSGTTALVGAENDPNNGTGTAYVFSDAGGTWTQRAELTPSDGGGAPEAFGDSVALSGTTALVGASGRNTDTGAVYVFSGVGGTWSQQAELTASDAAIGDRFGFSVALSGTTALIGAYGHNSTGAAYVFGVSPLGSQTITFTSTAPPGAVVGGPAYTVTATGGASGNPVTFSIDASSTSGCSLSGSTVSFGGPAGTCVIDANQAGNASYSPAAQAQQSFPVGSPVAVQFVATFPLQTEAGKLVQATLGIFTYPTQVPPLPLSAFTATIDWGDGNTSTATIENTTDLNSLYAGLNGYAIKGTHRYLTPDASVITITVQKAGDQPVTAGETVNISTPAPNANFMVAPSNPHQGVDALGRLTDGSITLLVPPTPSAFQRPVNQYVWDFGDGATVSDVPSQRPAYNSLLTQLAADPGNSTIVNRAIAFGILPPGSAGDRRHWGAQRYGST